MSFIASYIGGKRGAQKGLKPDYHWVTEDDRPILTGYIGAVVWLSVAVTYLVLAREWIVPLLILSLGWRRVYVTYQQDMLSRVEPTDLTPKAAPVASVRLLLYDSSTGPTVSVRWSTGEVVTNSFPTWREANAMAENVQHDMESDGIAVTVEIL